MYLSRGVHATIIICATAAVGATLYFIAGSIGLYIQNSNTAVVRTLAVLPWFLFACAGLAIWKKLSYRIVLPTLGLFGAFVIYLVWDLPTHPAGLDLGAVVSEESPSYQAYRWLLQGDPKNRLSEASTVPELPRLTGSPDDWAKTVKENRHIFEEAWANDKIGREWVDAMAAHAPEGIYPPPGPKGPALTFSVVRRLCTIRWGLAHGLLLDGKSDEAARTLLPLLRASYNLQRGGSSLVSQMIANVAIHGTFARLDLILAANNLSPAVRKEVADVLRNAPPVPQIIRKALLGEHHLARSTTDSTRVKPTEVAETFKLVTVFGDSEQNYDALSHPILVRLFYNPNRFERDHAVFLEEACHLAQQRQLDQTSEAAKSFETKTQAWRLKNPVGQLLTAMVLPAFKKIIPRFWEIEDQRVAFLSRLDPAHPAPQLKRSK